MAERWLRWYDGTVRDGKIQLVARLSELPVATVLGIWASLLEDSATNEPRGITSKGLEYHSLFLGISNQEIGTVWNAMERLEMIRHVPDHSETFEVLNWHKRQFTTDGKDPTAKERKFRWKQAHKNNETERNAAERSGTPETETETETDKKRTSSSDDDGFNKFWNSYPRKVGKKAAKRSFLMALKETSLHTMLRALAIDKEDWKDPKYTPHPATWLNQGRYLDHADASRPLTTYRPPQENGHDRRDHADRNAGSSQNVLDESARLCDEKRSPMGGGKT